MMLRMIMALCFGAANGLRPGLFRLPRPVQRAHELSFSAMSRRRSWGSQWTGRRTRAVTQGLVSALRHGRREGLCPARPLLASLAAAFFDLPPQVQCLVVHAASERRRGDTGSALTLLGDLPLTAGA